MRTAVPSPGDLVWIRQSRWRVERAHQDRGVLRLDVAGTTGARTFLAPFDHLGTIRRRARPRRVRPQHARSRLAGLVGRVFGVHTLPAAGAAAVKVLPYQLEPALAFATGSRRVLIADDVGLGKTIQAGAAIGELMRRDRSARVLILVPSALRRQWADELRVRFRLDATLADASSLDQLARTGARGDSPWHRATLWLASADFIKQAHVFDAMPIDLWDLLVIDEAHGVCGESSRNDACDRLARRARQVLLLTATPHIGDDVRFERLVDTGRLSGVPDALVVFRRTRRSLGLRIDRRVRWHHVRLSEAERQVLDVLVAFEHTALRDAGRHDAALLLLSVFRKRALSTMAALVSSLERRLRWLDLDDEARVADAMTQPTFDFADREDVLTGEEMTSLGIDIGLDRGHERSWLARLRLLADAARGDDRRIGRLVDLVRRTDEPVAIFTEFRDSLEALLPALSRVRMIATLHGGQSPAEQSRELDRFLSGSASVLLATDVASQGLNLQSRARWVISLELPWHPARIEQRAGRVDRIGQTRPVHVTLLVAQHDAETGLLARLLRRSLTAQRSLGADVLRDVAPDPARVRAALLSGASLDLAQPILPRDPIAICAHFSRPARATARRLVRQRAIATGTRDPAPEAAGPICVRREKLPAIARAAPAGTTLFTVPISDRTGAIVEQHVVAIAVRGHGDLASRDRVEACRRAAEQQLAPRLTRLRRLRQTRLAAEVARERALGAALVQEIALARESEPGLFDRRVAQREAEQHALLDVVHLETSRRVRALEDAAVLEIGTALFELILT